MGLGVFVRYLKTPLMLTHSTSCRWITPGFGHPKRKICSNLNKKIALWVANPRAQSEYAFAGLEIPY
jgi:hypothetical protein